jgi:hypothetical protein
MPAEDVHQVDELTMQVTYDAQARALGHLEADGAIRGN